MKEQSTGVEKRHLKIFSDILIRAAGISFVILLAWFGWLVAWSDFCARYYSVWFGLSQQEFVLLNFAGLVVFKIFCLAFFLIPFAAVKLYGRKMA